MKKRVIAINLPQFHPFPENDEWWGKGFTEWTNVTSSRPRFHGHYQPQLPTDTGFYDLRLPEARQMQADMAKEYGIYGFCYYHYWFNGKQLMERPVKEILSSGEPDFPFMLCWANENWARNWDGGFNKVLIAQNYSEEDDIAHMKYLCEKVFPDERYIKVDGKPVFCIYRPHYFPDMAQTIKTWREVASSYSMELYLCFCHHQAYDANGFLKMGYDAAVDFQPTNRGSFGKYSNLITRAYKKLFPQKINPFNTVYSYKNYVKYRCSVDLPIIKEYPCVCPGWDNSSRRQHSGYTIFKGNTPTLYKKWLAHIMAVFNPYSREENFVFINAWNEWAEGNHLEPDNKWGRSFLEATRDVINMYNNE